MARPIEAIVAAIEEFQPANGNWRALDELLGELFRTGAALQGVGAMLGVLERYPTGNGNGVFWSIVHGLESLPGYESYVVESARNTPSEFALVMVNRMLNVGTQDVAGVNLRSLLEQIAQDRTVHPELCRQARTILVKHGT